MSVFGNLFKGTAGFTHEYFNNFISAETALAPAHAAAGKIFDAVNGGMPLFNCFNNFGLAYFFAAADYIAPLFIFCD
jgi:hypothetical protein